MSTCTALGACALLAIVNTASAAVTFHTSEAAFVSNLSTFAIDTFDDLPAFSGVGVAVARTFGPLAYSASATSGLFTAGSGADTDVWLSTNVAAEPLIILPSAGLLTAIGGRFFTTDLIGSASPGDVLITVTDGDGTQTFTLTNTGPSTFLGITSDRALVELRIQSLASPSPIWPTVNNLIIGRAIPSPGAAALLGMGGWLAGRRRRGDRSR